MFAKPLFNHRLQPLMSADTGSGGQAATGDEGGQGEGKTEGETKTEQKENMIPQSRFNEVNDSYKALKAELDKMKADSEKAATERQTKEQEDAEKKGEFEGLYSKAKNDLEALKGENKSTKSRVESLEGVIQGLLDAKLQTIDKDYHDLIPEGMTPEQKLAWVTNAEAKGIFGRQTQQKTLGEQTNPNGNQEVDINSLNPMQMLMAGYEGKK
jgi:ribonucleoside-triphosphate reductase